MKRKKYNIYRDRELYIVMKMRMILRDRRRRRRRKKGKRLKKISSRRGIKGSDTGFRTIFINLMH